MTTKPKWGQSITIPEPGPGQRQTIAMVSLTEGNVHEMMGDGGGTPPVRDWTVYGTAQGLNMARLAAPNAVLVIRYGSAASAFERRARIPVVGMVAHVVATWIDVTIEVLDSSLPPVGDIQVDAFASPGRPVRQVIAEHAFNGLQPSPVIIPPFAIGWHGVETSNSGTDQLDAVWRYNGLNRGGPGNVSAQQVDDAWNVSHAIPRDANQILLLPSIPPVNLHWWWVVLS